METSVRTLLIFITWVVFSQIGHTHCHDNTATTTRNRTSRIPGLSILNISQPIKIFSQPRKVIQMCTDLCLSGLGGTACPLQVRCHELLRKSIQSKIHNVHVNSNKLQQVNTQPRKEACPFLCRKGLGEPLCKCSENYPLAYKFIAVKKTVNWNEICVFYCITYDQHINGCKKCHQLRAEMLPNEDLEMENIKESGLLVSSTEDPSMDWDDWCRGKCKQHDGGLACNCDFFPIGY